MRLHLPLPGLLIPQKGHQPERKGMLQESYPGDELRLTRHVPLASQQVHRAAGATERWAGAGSASETDGGSQTKREYSRMGEGF